MSGETSASQTSGLIARTLKGIRLPRYQRAGHSGKANDANVVNSDPLSLEVLRALHDDQLSLVYQPKINLRQRQIVSLEALLRWNHPNRGNIAPGAFIPVIENDSVIQPVSKWVFSTAIRDQSELIRRGHRLPIYVNVAGSLLADADFIAETCDAVTAADAAIGIEITETSVIRDPERAITNLRYASSRGIPIAIDDYGAGLSSLAYLKQLPATELKIDKLFITQLTSTNRDPLIVRSTIDLAHAMEMEVVAEGIEDETALALLTVMGCDIAQGYHISRPLSLSALVPFLDKHAIRWEAEDFTGRSSVKQFLTNNR